MIYKNILRLAINNTFKNRNVIIDVDLFNNVVNEIENDNSMKNKWIYYQERNDYAKHIKFDDLVDSVKIILRLMEE